MKFRSLICLMICGMPLYAADREVVERGYKALTTKSFIPAAWRPSAYDNVWKRWAGVTAKPSEYDKAFREHYGLHPAPYPNDNYPMGMRTGVLLVIKGISIDCMICHGGSIMGKSYVGLGNASFDIQSFFEDMSAADGRSSKLPFTFSNVRGTSEAGSFAVYLMGMREPDLKMKTSRQNLGLHDDLCEDVPAWWVLKKKKTMYYTGGAHADSVRSKMQFMLTPITPRSDFDKHEAAFRDINEYIKSIEAPKYPFAINTQLASEGRRIFTTNCSSCHGTYGEKWTYPNKNVPIDEIGTDPSRLKGIEDQFGWYYNESWFAKEKKGWFLDGYTAIPTYGYQAPPLDGIWATAPYLHNGSVPTLYDVLKSDSRPKLYTRSFKTDEEDYDKEKIGWKITNLLVPPSSRVPSSERLKVYDTSKPGRSNKGHTYGDHLTEDERKAVIEYLKTL